MSILRYGLIALGGLSIAALFGSQIKALENIKQTGETVLLDLRPVDPRALMMGDFMALRYSEEVSQDLPKDIPPSGKFVLNLDENNVGSYVRLAKPLLGPNERLAKNEIIINYIRQKRGVTFGAPRYYFQNGTAETYEAGEYGIFRIAPSGRAILVGLADEDFKRIEPPKS